MEFIIELDWLRKHMKMIRSSQPAILILNWIIHSFVLWVSLSSKINSWFILFRSNAIWWSSLICNASARQERDKCDKSDTSATRVRHERHECDTSEKNFDFENYTSKNIFSHSYIYYMASERLKGKEQFHFKYCLLKCLIPIPKCVWKMHHKNWTL